MCLDDSVAGDAGKEEKNADKEKERHRQERERDRKWTVATGVMTRCWF